MLHTRGWDASESNRALDWVKASCTTLVLTSLLLLFGPGFPGLSFARHDRVSVGGGPGNRTLLDPKACGFTGRTASQRSPQGVYPKRRRPPLVTQGGLRKSRKRLLRPPYLPTSGLANKEVGYAGVLRAAMKPRLADVSRTHHDPTLWASELCCCSRMKWDKFGSELVSVWAPYLVQASVRLGNLQELFSRIVQAGVAAKNTPASFAKRR